MPETDSTLHIHLENGKWLTSGWELPISIRNNQRTQDRTGSGTLRCIPYGRNTGYGEQALDLLQELVTNDVSDRNKPGAVYTHV